MGISLTLMCRKEEIDITSRKKRNRGKSNPVNALPGSTLKRIPYEDSVFLIRSDIRN